MSDYNKTLSDAMTIDGALGVALVEATSGMALATAGNPGIDLNVAAAGNSSVIQAKRRTMHDLGIKEQIEDILITLDSQYHLIRMIDGGRDNLFMYLVLDKQRANLAMARFKLSRLEKELEL